MKTRFSGWFNESHRHSLASRGISTRLMSKTLSSTSPRLGFRHNASKNSLESRLNFTYQMLSPVEIEKLRKKAGELESKRDPNIAKRLLRLQSGATTKQMFHQPLQDEKTAEIWKYWDPRRRALQHQLLGQSVRASEAIQKKHFGRPIVMYTGGLPASGKTSALKELFNIKRGYRGGSPMVMQDAEGREFLLVSSDDIKESMPEFETGLGSAKLHEESSLLAQEIIADATKRGINIIVDSTLSKVPRTKEELDAFKKAGYQTVLLEVYAPPSFALESAYNRENSPEEGRVVPLNVIVDRAVQLPTSISQLKPEFDVVYSTSRGIKSKDFTPFVVSGKPVFKAKPTARFEVTQDVA